MSDEEDREIIGELPDGRKIYIERPRRRAPGLTVGVGAEGPAGDDLTNLPDADDGKEN